MFKRLVDADWKRRGFSRCETRCARVFGGGRRGLLANGCNNALAWVGGCTARTHSRGLLIERIAERLAGLERRHRGGGDGDALPGRGVAALARRPTPGGKGPEARDRDLFAARQCLGNGGEYRGDGAVRRGPGDGGPRGDAGRQLGLVHGFSPRGAIVHRCRTRLRIRVPRRRTARNGGPGKRGRVSRCADTGSRDVVSGESGRAEARGVETARWRGRTGGARRRGEVRSGLASAHLSPAARARSRARSPRASATAPGPRPSAWRRTPSGSGSVRTAPAGAGGTRPAGGGGR